MASAQEAYVLAVKIAQSYTKRKKVFILADSNEFVDENPHTCSLQAGNAAQLCEAIALTDERIAAIIIRSHRASHFYYKKVRELSSAEGALMIWDRLTNHADQKIARHCIPDIAIFTHLRVAFLLAKKELMYEENIESIDFDGCCTGLLATETISEVNSLVHNK